MTDVGGCTYLLRCLDVALIPLSSDGNSVSGVDQNLSPGKAWAVSDEMIEIYTR